MPYLSPKLPTWRAEKATRYRASATNAVDLNRTTGLQAQTNASGLYRYSFLVGSNNTRHENGRDLC